MTPDTLTVAIGADHGGFVLKDTLRQALEAAGHHVIDFGTDNGLSVDYPDFAHAVCDAVTHGRARFGVLVCGSGIGMQMAANRHEGIRCAVLHDTTEARLSRAHNNANVAAFGERLTGPQLALDALTVFLDTEFEGGRHERRIAKLTPLTAPMPLGPIDLPESEADEPESVSDE